MEKKELLEKTNEIKESAAKLFKQVDAYLGFNGRVAVIFGLTVITMLGMILDRVDEHDGFRSDRNEFRQERNSARDDRQSQRNDMYGGDSFDQRYQRRSQMMGDDFDQAFQQMDQMRNQMQNMMQNGVDVQDQNSQSDSFFGRMKNRMRSWFANEQDDIPQIVPAKVQAKIETMPNATVQNISVNNGSIQYTINDQNGQVSGSATVQKEAIDKLVSAITALGLTTKVQDTTVSFEGKLSDINSLLKLLESN